MIFEDDVEAAHDTFAGERSRDGQVAIDVADGHPAVDDGGLLLAVALARLFVMNHGVVCVETSAAAAPLEGTWRSEDEYRHEVVVLRPGGVAILSGLLRTQERRVLAAYRSRGFRLLRRIHRDAWATLVLERP